MTEKIITTLRDKKAARWTALILLALMMFFAYMFVDVLSPLKSMLETHNGWSSETYLQALNIFLTYLPFS